MELRDALTALYQRAATSVPADIERALRGAERKEAEGPARAALGMILGNLSVARNDLAPLCQDTGTPVFFVGRPEGMSERSIRDAIIRATKSATASIPLRANAVDSLTGKNSGNNIGSGVPVIHFREVERAEPLAVQLLLKGGGSENVGRTYSLPSGLRERDLGGVKACVLDCVRAAQGKGCPPGVIGVAFGSPRQLVVEKSFEQLLRPLDDENPVPELRKAERQLLQEINATGIGPMGFGGKATALGVKVAAVSRHPASFFVDVSYSCWALRRSRLTFKEGVAKFD